VQSRAGKQSGPIRHKSRHKRAPLHEARGSVRGTDANLPGPSDLPRIVEHEDVGLSVSFRCIRLASSLSFPMEVFPSCRQEFHPPLFALVLIRGTRHRSSPLSRRDVGPPRKNLNPRFHCGRVSASNAPERARFTNVAAGDTVGSAID